MNKQWKPVIGYEGLYEVSSDGQVKSLARKKFVGNNYYWMRDKILSPRLRNGYLAVCLNKLGKQKTFNLHRLVAMHFIENPSNKSQVNHINGIKTDNCAENLEWVTQRENAIHSYKNGLSKPVCGEENHFSKLTLDQVLNIKDLYKRGNITQKEIGEKYDISPATVSDIVRGRRWAKAVLELKEREG